MSHYPSGDWNPSFSTVVVTAYTNTNPASNTYYSVVSYAGSGYLQLITVIQQTAVTGFHSWNGEGCDVAVGINSGTAVSLNALLTDANHSLDEITAYADPGSTWRPVTMRRLEFGGGGIRFTSSLLVQVKPFTSGNDLKSSVLYTTG